MASESAKILSDLIREASRIVFLGGAGVSTESGIPDFRGSGGLYTEKTSVPPEVILSHTFFLGHTEEFYRFYPSSSFADTKTNGETTWYPRALTTSPLSLKCVRSTQ